MEVLGKKGSTEKGGSMVVHVPEPSSWETGVGGS